MEPRVIMPGDPSQGSNIYLYFSKLLYIRYMRYIPALYDSRLELITQSYYAG